MPLKSYVFGCGLQFVMVIHLAKPVPRKLSNQHCNYNMPHINTSVLIWTLELLTNN